MLSLQPVGKNLITPRVGEITPEPESLSEENRKLILEEKKEDERSENEQIVSKRLKSAYLVENDAKYSQTDLIKAMQALMGTGVYKGSFVLQKSKQLDEALKKIGFTIALVNSQTLGGYYMFAKKDMKILFERLLNPSIQNLTPEAKAEITTFATMLTVLMKLNEVISHQGKNEEYYNINLTKLQVKILEQNSLTFSGGNKNSTKFRLSKEDVNDLGQDIFEKLSNKFITSDPKTFESIRTDKQIQKTIDEIGGEGDSLIESCSTCCCKVCGFSCCACFASLFLCVFV